MVTETKLDHSFPNGQFLVSGCKTNYGLDRNLVGSGIMLYIKEHIPLKKIIFL